MTTTLTAPGAPAAVAAQTRLRAVALQIEFVLRHTTNLEWWLPQMAHGLENHWLWTIGIVGLERNRRAWALLCLELDWAKHDAERTAGRFLVRFANDKHPEGATSLVTATTGWLRDVVAARGLQTECRVVLTEAVEGDRKLRAQAIKEMRLRPAAPIRWVAGPREHILKIFAVEGDGCYHRSSPE
jgi:hypothetical protein